MLTDRVETGAILPGHHDNAINLGTAQHLDWSVQFRFFRHNNSPGFLGIRLDFVPSLPASRLLMVRKPRESFDLPPAGSRQSESAGSGRALGTLQTLERIDVSRYAIRLAVGKSQTAGSPRAAGREIGFQKWCKQSGQTAEEPPNTTRVTSERLHGLSAPPSCWATRAKANLVSPIAQAKASPLGPPSLCGCQFCDD